MKVFKALLIFILIIVGVLLFLEIIPVAPKYHLDNNPWIIEEGSRPLIIPHGGGKSLYPESTIYAFRKLDEDGYDVFEVDLTLTKDDKLISHHDIDLSRTTGDNDKIISLTYEEIVNKFIDSEFASSFRNYNDEAIENIDSVKSEIVPATLEYLFDNYQDKMFVLEIKDTIENSGEGVFIKAVDELLKLINHYNMENNVIVGSFDDDVIKEIRDKTNNQIMTATGTKESLKFLLYSSLRIDFFYRPKDAALILPFEEKLSDSQTDLIKKIPKFVSKHVVAENNDESYTDVVKEYIIKDAHRHNMAIHYWTVNDKEDMIKLIKLGVDGIVTDRPDILLEVYEELGLN